ncbi:MAG: phosphate acyltransferase PlsX [Xanthomonadales bacterium]|nr:phosphate acyltransferase PlsX [Gammaproteobacteria bacterium]MBT8052148.1 phosphate acyltransferase PlsX [Gammaproteobacteria bacterium]MBT8056833.1 phosphate acyltransferase PlsX [Gammaproteobacteria bacterium]NNJ79483.1 phosphate acyltransferase PlsX [Xanthomonadales bacterium]NNL05621.1 phosphate acyltransferase PlsX [Xanthomonadales bacterium]
MKQTILALDVHGGDQGLDVSVPAALAALAQDPHLDIILVGRESAIEAALESNDGSPPFLERLQVEPAHSIVPMDAKPAHVLRRGRDSSLWKTFELVAEDRADACVSGGGTAAMMVTGVKLLGMLQGIQRPALMAWLPNDHAYTGMLDLGANLNVGADQLVQFAVMGDVTARIAEGIEAPRVGLLNVGHEDSKGHDTVQQAHERLRNLPLNYVGFIEGNGIFDGSVDIAVCDGFAGNLVLKSTEGLARMLMQQFREAFSDNLASKAGAWLAAPTLKRMLARLDPSAHNGAPLLGLRRVAVKSHGSSDLKGMTRAILEAGREARRQVPGKIEALVREYQLESAS